MAPQPGEQFLVHFLRARVDARDGEDDDAMDTVCGFTDIVCYVFARKWRYEGDVESDGFVVGRRAGDDGRNSGSSVAVVAMMIKRAAAVVRITREQQKR